MSCPRPASTCSGAPQREQLLLTLIIPLVLLVAGSAFNLSGRTDASAINVITPGILALAVMSTAFTSLAIAVGLTVDPGRCDFWGPRR